MRYHAAICFFVMGGCALSEGRKAGTPLPTEFEIGRQTFFDFGPPLEYYELLLVHPTSSGSSIDRIILTPAADACTVPAKIETKSVLIKESVASLLGTTNPCTIPDKELRRELKRCKKCLVFSGVNVRMRVRCGTKSRIIRSDILDRDIFGASADTPEHTSWTMELLGRLDVALGPGIMKKPVFPIPQKDENQENNPKVDALEDVRAGRYDELFPGAAEKPSELYVASQIRPPVPTVRLISSSPMQPEVFVQPSYPPVARLAKIQGIVKFNVTIDVNGNATQFILESGHPMFKGTVEKAVDEWKFSKDAAHQQIHASIEFAMNCPPQHR